MSFSRKKTFIFLIMSSLLAAFSCKQPVKESEDPEIPIQSLKVFSSEQLFKQTEAPKCKFLLDSYCNYLYSPEAQGNLEIRRAQSSTKVLQGETSNDFSQVYYHYSLAKLKNRKSLPADLYATLNRDGYFTKLREFLGRKSRKAMSIEQRVAAEKLDYELGSMWSASLNETVLNRMVKKYPGFHQLPDRLIPIELSLENRRIRRTLIIEISRAIWRNDKNWGKVEKGFARLRQSYLDMIHNLDVAADIKNDWLRRISEVQLVMPGSMPAIANEECSSTTVNAYYYTYLNVITICAGDFNSEDIIQTLAHEMGHALGIDRTQYLFQVNSAFGKKLSTFRTQICEPKKFSCDKWEEYKGSFLADLQSLNNFKPELPEFQRCLKRRPTSKTLDDEQADRFASTIVNDRVSSLASSDRFLRITKESVPTPAGKNQKNPNYLNPCSYYMWSEGEEPVDDELTTLMYFTAEYRCSDKPPVERMKQAIEIAKTMSVQVLEKTLQIEGEFSSRSLLESEGYASPPYERFADVVGSYAMAEYLKQIPNKWDRQNKFLASSSWQCLEPSLANHYPDESAIEKEYIFEAHTEGDQRRKELFSTPIREVIGCEKDFEFNECQLPFKKSHKQ